MCNKNKTAVTNFKALLNFVLLLLNLLHVTPVTFCKLYSVVLACFGYDICRDSTCVRVNTYVFAL